MKSLNYFLAVLMMILAPSVAQAADDRNVYFHFDKDYGGKYMATRVAEGAVMKVDNLDAGFFGSSSIGIDTISSIDVGKGVKVTLYEQRYCQEDDKKLVLWQGKTPRLLDWNDKISSIKIEGVKGDAPVARFFQDNGSYDDNAVQSLGIGLYHLDQLLKNDCFSMFSCDKGIVVRVWDADGANVAPKTGGKVISDSDPTKGRFMVNLGDFGMADNISAISIEPAGYQITKQEILAPVEGIRTPLGEVELVAEFIVKNESSQPAKGAYDMERQYSTTITRSWSNATTAGIESTVGVTAEAGVPGFGSVAASASLTLKLANTFTIGGDDTKTETKTLKSHVELEVMPGKSRRVVMTMQPMQVVYNIRYTWSVNNDPATAFTTTDKVTMKLDQSMTAVFKDGPDVLIVPGSKNEVKVSK